MFFVKITDQSNVTRIINLESVTLCGIRTVMTNGVNQELCEVTYHMGGGTFSTFLLDCNLEQFLDYIQYVFNCPGNPHTLVDHLLTNRPPNEWKVGDTVRVTDPSHPCHRELGTLLEKTDYPWVVQSHKRTDSVYYLASDQLEFVHPATTPVKKSDIETLARMNAILSEANLKVRRRKEAEEILSEILTNSSPQELDKYDASPRNPLPISGIRRKTQPDVSQEFVQELLNELPQPSPDFHPGDTVEVIDSLHPQFGCIGIVIPDIKLHPTPSLVVIRIEGKNTQHDYTLQKDQIQHHSPQESDS